MSPLTTTIKFGKTIGKEEASELYDRFIRIKKDSAGDIRKAVAHDAEALRYYCGRKGSQAEHEDLAYLFSKESLLNILANIERNGGDGMVIFHGARPYEGDLSEQSGRPTLMMFPFQLNETIGQDGESTFSIVNLLDEGEEHPGTGGDGDGGDGSIDGRTPIPGGFDQTNVHKMKFSLNQLLKK